MSCIANFYLDGVKYSLEDYDMNTKSAKRLLQKVIDAAKSQVNNETREQGIIADEAPDHNDILNQLNRQTGQPLREQDDEDMLKELDAIMSNFPRAACPEFPTCRE